MNRFDDTIAAIATAPGQSGIAIVRISGPESVSVAERIFVHRAEIETKLSKLPSHRAVLGHIIDSDQRVIDEVLILVMRAPKSFTREDIVEIQCHGGGVTARRILRLVLLNGARQANPGEFTQRAFLNGRLDLTQAEAILDLIHAQTERAAASAVEQLEGGLTRTMQPIYEACIALAADIEASLDFPEDEIPPRDPASIRRELSRIERSVSDLLKTFTEGRLLREGAMAVICGAPNTGKSTLLNTLLEHDRAIVSDIPGTTRDSIEETIALDGFPLRLVDTAGLREAGCSIEEEGIRRTRHLISRADIVLHLLDATRPIREILQEIRDTQILDTHLFIVNKCDLVRESALEKLPEWVWRMSLKTGAGVESLRATLREHIERGIDMRQDQHATISERHHTLLTRAQNAIEKALALSNTVSGRQDPSVEWSIHLRDAGEALGEILGRTYSDEILNAIFSRFCIGK